MAPKLILNMIVKNEEANIEANFTSVKHLVDGFLILDTGSTDGTIAKMHECAKNLGLPIKVFEEPFVNFGVSRTRAQILARESLGKDDFASFTEDDTQCVFLDADAEMIEMYDPQKTSQLPLQKTTIDKFKKHLEDKKPPSMFQNHVLPNTEQSRLGVVKMNFPWECKNACHEQWEGPVENPATTAPWKVFEKPTGGNKPTKTQRELDLLQKDIEGGNRTPRNLFYYGRALDSVGKAEEALQILEECIRETKWAEERYECRLITGRIWALREGENTKAIQAAQEIFDKAKKSEAKFESWKVQVPWPNALDKAYRIQLSAHEDCPARCEALQFLAFHLRLAKEQRNACEILRVALENVELPREESDLRFKDSLDIAWTAFVSSLFHLPGSWLVAAQRRKTSLFQNREILHDKLLQELSISAFQVQDPEWRLRGHRAAEFLVKFGRSERTVKHGEATLAFQNGTHDAKKSDPEKADAKLS